ncbi:MAG: ribonuclease J [Chloroflexota bacterium]|nr:ribonuclease J [Chloroflexota bacterium]
MSEDKKLRIIPLGGLGEIAKNCMVLEYGDDIVLIDAGVMFPEDEMLGIDLVIPDISYLEDKRDRIRAIIITHGHEDHTGALPYFLRSINAPIYGTRLTLGLLEVKLKEHGLNEKVSMREIAPGDQITLGPFRFEFFHMCHSIPDGVGMAIYTPVGLVVHSGDFKFDYTPVDGELSDIWRLAKYAQEGVRLLLSDSTRADRPGYTPSERVIYDCFAEVFSEARGRIIVTTFASLISRVQQVVDIADEFNRSVCVTGRSMVQNVNMAMQLGYLDVPANMLVRPDRLHEFNTDEVVIITTGSQGEPTSALGRIANRDHRQINVETDDTVIISASPIPGNEALVGKTIDKLFRQGADVLYDRVANVHVSGHGAQEELKTLLSILRPEAFIPIHGGYQHLMHHARLAGELGVDTENIIVAEDGDIIELTTDEIRKVDRVQAGYVFVDGLGVGDVSESVLRDRQHLSQGGIFIVVVAIDRETGHVLSGPDIIARGFMQEGLEMLIEKARHRLYNNLEADLGPRAEIRQVQERIRDVVSTFLYAETRRRPMILPVVTEV